MINQSAKGTEMTDSIRNSKKKEKHLDLHKTFTRRMPNGIMDGFIRKLNQKVNLPGFALLKDGYLKTCPIKKFQICLKM